MVRRIANINLKLCLLVFCVGALIQFDVTLIARVPLGELLAFCAIPFLWRGLQLGPYSQRFGWVMAVLGIWAFGILLSDMFNLFIFQRFVRAFMKPAFSFLWMLFFAGILLRDFRALLFYPAGRVLASLQNYVAPRAFTEEYLQAGGYEAVAYGVMPIVLSCSLAMCVYIYRKHHLWSMCCFGFSAAVLLYFGSPRSAVGMQLFNAALVFYLWWVHSGRRRKFELSLGRLIGLGLGALICCTAIYYVYVFAALEGWLGELQYDKIIDQQKTIFGTTPLGLILGGRTEVFAAILAIIDNPFLGYGSWTGWMMADYYFEAVAMTGTDARDINLLLGNGGGGLAGHSVLFQGWMENGFLSAVALLAIAYRVFRQMLLLIQYDNRLAPLFISMGTSFAWSFMFSPFGVGTRIAIGLFLALYLTAFLQQSGVQRNMGNRYGNR